MGKNKSICAATHKLNAKNVCQEVPGKSDGIIARTMETQTAELPADIFLWGALGSIGLSLYFEIRANAEKSRFVGQWVSPFLLLGVYNKLTKMMNLKEESENVKRI